MPRDRKPLPGCGSFDRAVGSMAERLAALDRHHEGVSSTEADD